MKNATWLPQVSYDNFYFPESTSHKEVFIASVFADDNSYITSNRGNSNISLLF